MERNQNHVQPRTTHYKHIRLTNVSTMNKEQWDRPRNVQDISENIYIEWSSSLGDPKKWLLRMYSEKVSWQNEG